MLVAGLFFAILFNTASSIYQIQIEDYDDDLYLIEIQLGTPKQNFTVQLDSSSSGLWVVDSTCTSKQCKGHTKAKSQFNASASRTFQEDGHEFLIKYDEDQAVEGKIGRDTLTVNNLELEKQNFGRVLLMDQVFGQLPIDGVFGIGQEKLSQTGVKSPLQNILEALDDSSFSIWLNSHSSGKKLGGTLTFGGYDDNNCESEWTYTKLSQPTYWSFKFSKFTFGEYSFTLNFAGITSTSESTIAMPKQIFKQIIKKLNASLIPPYDDVYGIPCSDVDKAPELSFEIDGKQYTVTPREYIRKANFSKEKCTVFLYDSSIKGFNKNQFIFGDPFLRSYCTNYSFEKRQIGFAKAKTNQ